MNTGASNFVELVDLGFYIIIGISLLLLLGVTAVMIYFVIRYNKKRNPKASNIEGNNKLEIIWTVIPTILVMVMFYYGWVGYSPMRKVPEGALEIKAIGRMWSWTFEYGNGIKSDKLIVPLNKPVKLNLRSLDVNHALYIPAFRIKEDVTPGNDNYMWFNANIVGTYDIFCAEYCGLQHSYMITKLEVIPEADYNDWYAKGSVIDTTRSTADLGYDILKNNGCIACHSTDGTKLVGPSFKDLWGSTKTVLSNDKEITLTADEEYIRSSIFEPKKDVVVGYSPLMPEYSTQIKPEEIGLILDYLKSISENK